MKDNSEDSYGYFEDVIENDVILNYSDEDLPNYKSGLLTINVDFIKKKRDSYDDTYNHENHLKYAWHDCVRKCRINTLLCIHCCWPFIIVSCLVSVSGWILYKF